MYTANVSDRQTKGDETKNEQGVNRRKDKTAGRALTCQDDHVHPPEDAHDPPDHDDSCQYLDEGGCHVEPEHTTNSSL